MVDSWTIIGALVMGVLFGIFLCHPVAALSDRMRHGNGLCELCGRLGHLSVCKRCRRKAGMCCRYTVLGFDPTVPMREVHLCSDCISAQERKALEEMLEKPRSHKTP